MSIKYICWFDVVRVLPGGKRIAACYHGPGCPAGFATYEDAVKVRDSLYYYYRQCQTVVVLEIVPIAVAEDWGAMVQLQEAEPATDPDVDIMALPPIPGYKN